MTSESQPHSVDQSTPSLPAIKGEQIARFCQDNGIRSLALFGSHLHGDADIQSDIDLLVEFEPQRRVGFFELARMELDLTDLLGHKIDLRTPAELSLYFRQQVMDEARVVYAH